MAANLTTSSDAMVNRVEACVQHCQSVMNQVKSWMDSHSIAQDKSEKMAEYLLLLENYQTTLEEVLSSVDITSPSNQTRQLMHALVGGHSVAAQLQPLKRRLHCHDDKSVATLGTSENSREVESHHIECAITLQRELLRFIKGEDDVVLEKYYSSQQEQSHEFTLNAEKTWPSTFPTPTSLVDTDLIGKSLARGYAAEACQQPILAANDFALVLKLLSTKCHVVDELTSTAFKLLTGDELESDVPDAEMRQKGSAMWLEAIRSKVHPDVVSPPTTKGDFSTHMHSPLTHVETSQLDAVENEQGATIVSPIVVSIAFASLLWNAAFCMWQSGDVGEAHRWLCACDVRRLLRIAEEEKTGQVEEQEQGNMDGDEKHNMTSFLNEQSIDDSGSSRVACDVDVFNTLDWKYVLNPPRHRDPTSIVGIAQTKEGDATDTDKEVSPKCLLGRLARRILGLRDLCDIMLHCSTPQDVLCVLCEMDNALQIQQRKMVKRGLDATGSDSTAEVLTVVLRLVEFYLARRAVRVMRLQSLSGTEAEAHAVRHVCDELIRFLTKGKYASVEETEDEGLPLTWYTRDPHVLDGSGEDWASTSGVDLPLGPRWLSVQALSLAITFAGTFRQSELFHAAQVSSNAKPTPRPSRAREETLFSSWTETLSSKLHAFVWGETTTRESQPMAQQGEERMTQRRRSQSLMENGRRGRRSSSSSNDSAQPHRRRSDSLVPQSSAPMRSNVTAMSPHLPLLQLPSLFDHALTLLAEETDGTESNKENEATPNKELDANDVHTQLALRLLAIARRYCASQKLLPLSVYLLQLVVPELNRVIALLESELNHRVGSTWITVWKRARTHSAGRTQTAALTNPNAPDSTESASACWSASDDAPNSAEEDAHPAGSELLESPPPMYTPPLTFDFDAFALSSAEALLATRRTMQTLRAAEESGGPNACGVSLLSPLARRALHAGLSMAHQLTPWRLVYSTRFHGVSFARMLASSAREAAERRPMILIVQPRPKRDASTSQTSSEGEGRRSGLVFGAVLSEPLVCRTSRFYGTSETFLFQLQMPPKGFEADAGVEPPLRTFRSTGVNTQYIHCRPHALAIGGSRGGDGEAGCGIFINECLTKGATAACTTFASPPLTQWESSPNTAASMMSCSFEIETLELIAVGEARHA